MNVVVTGASRGIGHACVEAFQATGAFVIGVDLEESSSADEHHTLDLSSEDCGERLAALAGDREIHSLVNNAAVASYVPAVETQLSDWDTTMAVNLRAPFLLARSLHPNLESARGSVINVASVHALATSTGVAAYAASKGGLVSLTRALALEWAPDVRVNCVLPGAIDTGMLADGLFRTEATVETLGSRHPLERVGQPEEVAAAAIFLSESEFITGASLVVDGGAMARLSTE